jgi:hypothetical protein
LPAVAFLQFAGELVAFAGNDVQVIIGQFALFLLDLALELHPVALDLIPVHVEPPLKMVAGKTLPHSQQTLRQRQPSNLNASREPIRDENA